MSEALATREVPSVDLIDMGRRLNRRQRQYCRFMIEFEGDFKKAAQRAGYSPATVRASIEKDDDVREYLNALLSEAAVLELLSARTVIARINDIAVRAAAEKDYANALRANRMLGDALGIFEARPGQSGGINGDGAPITITPKRSKADDDAIDAEYKEILALNAPASGSS